MSVVKVMFFSFFLSSFFVCFCFVCLLGGGMGFFCFCL